MKVVLRHVKKFYILEGLKKACQEKGISQRELARRLKISPAYLCDISLGRRYLSHTLMLKIKKELQ